MSPTATSFEMVSVRAPQQPTQGTTINVTSASFDDGGSIDMDFVFTGCGGRNQSPQLSWGGAPSGTKSFVVTCFDPDAPTGAGFWHWLVFDIPSSVTKLDAGVGKDRVPAGAKGASNDYGYPTYGGPCPPKGDGAHRYIFTVYALDIDSLPHATEKTHGAPLIFQMRGHVLASGSITGTFGH